MISILSEVTRNLSRFVGVHLKESFVLTHFQNYELERVHSSLERITIIISKHAMHCKLINEENIYMDHVY